MNETPPSKWGDFGDTRETKRPYKLRTNVGPDLILYYMSDINQNIHVELLQYLEEHPKVTLRELARHLGVNLGKANYC